MKIRNLLILGMVLLGFTYCSSDDLVDGQKPGTEEATGVKMQVTIGMPTTRTRTATSDGMDTNNGTADEAKVNKVLIAIYDVNHNLVTTHTSTVGTADTDGKYTTGEYVTEQFTINSLKVGSQYNVYAFANPYEGLDAVLLSTSYDKGAFPVKEAFAATIDAITKNGTTQDNFFMSNATTSEVVTVLQTNVLGAPLDVKLNVERAVARFDASVGKTADNFELTVAEVAKTAGIASVSVAITDYKLMNNSKSFFNLKRVNDGTTTDIGGAETSTNYVVDTDWDNKVKTEFDWTTSFHSYMGSVTKVDDLTPYNKIADKAYATENTIPDAAKNIKGVATAIVFKGDLVFTGSTSTDLTEDVYVWNNQFYGVFENLPAGIRAIGKDEKAALASAGVTAYSKVGEGDDAKYPIYYVYYNAHNQSDAQKALTTVGPMEFGVVRNNIYKLEVNSITKFGHPNDPELVYDPETSNPDPNPENPKDPIKSSDLYMQVTATVNPWTVRTNVIDF